ncbi:MAG: hypothetical protein WKF77_15910 [Planctomycetaceae bacterium]
MSNATSVSDSLMKKKDVAEFFQCSVRQVELMVKAGKLPKPVYIGDASPRWQRKTLMEWLDRLQAAESATADDG